MSETMKCAYCGKERPQEELERGKITFIGYNSILRKRKVETKENWYCADNDCYGNDQMSHEG